MFENLNENCHFEPLHDAHSIDQVLFTIQFERPLSDEQLLNIRQTSLAKFKNSDHFPAIQDIQLFPFNVGIGIPMTAQNGFQLFRTGNDGILETELRVERNSVIFRTSRYTRWEEIWGKVNVYFQHVIPLFTQDGNKLMGVGLSYYNKFLSRNETKKCKAKDLLNSQSKYLCTHLFENDDLWHNHTGAYIKINKEIKRLININIDSFDELSDNVQHRAIAIAIIVTDLLNQPQYNPSIFSDEDIIMKLKDKFHALHLCENDIFRDILNEKSAKRVGLKS